MPDLQQLARDFLAAIAANDPDQFATVLHDDVGLRSYRWDGSQMLRPRHRVVPYLMDEWSAWPDPSIETLTITADGARIAIEFRIQATEHDQYVEHYRSAFLSIKDDKIYVIDLYCAEPLPSARRKNWIAPANLTDEELTHLFDSIHIGDPREYIYPDGGGHRSLRGGHWGGGEPHPGSNGVGNVRWTAEEADERIEALIDYHRRRNCGFQWMVGPFDTPADLRERLERHGLILAGDAATMAHTHLDQLDIPINPDVTIEIMDGYDEAAIDAMIDIMVACFNMPPEETARQRPIWVNRMRDPVQSQRNTNYLARLNGQPAGFARLMLNAGVAYLAAGSTLPQFRGQRVYSTLLRRRLEDARDKGYHIAAIQAEPLSRPIVTRCGFKEYARTYIYGWMPVIDVDVIKSLVPQ
jgi:GNAT superfamily N-acetyltransferase/ketosteroid isomerase-like protein